MKPRILSAARLSLPLALAIASLLYAPSAKAVTYYWDQNSTTTGFGTAGGTWNATGSSTWNTVATGLTGPIVATTTLNTSATDDAVNFGTGTTGGGLGTGTITVGTVAAGNITFGSLSGAITLSGGSIALTAAATITVNNSSGATIGTTALPTVLSGAATSLTKAGTGILTLNGTNTYAGSLTIAAGTVRVGSAAAAGGNATIIGNNTAAGSTFASAGATALSFSKNLSTNVAGGGITFGDATGTGNLTFTGSLTRAGGATTRAANVAGATVVTFNGDLLSPGTPTSATTFTKGGTGTLAIRGLGSTTDGGFSNVIVTGGTLSVTRLANLGAACSLGRATGATAGAVSITLDGGILSYIDGGAAASTTDRLLQIGRTTAAAVGTVRNDATNATQTVTFSNPNAIAYGTVDQTRSLVLAGTNPGMNTFASAIGDNGTASVTLAKQNAGTWGLSGNNTYTGTTTITGGTLALTGSGSINNSSGITINGSGVKLLQTSSVAMSPVATLTQGTVTGSGTVNTVNVGNSIGGIISNNNGVPGAGLTVNTLSFSGAATVNTFHAAGDFSTAIATTNLSTSVAGLVTINPTASVWTNGTYSLMSYTGGIGGAGAGQIGLGAVSGLSARQTPVFTDTGSAFTLTISGDVPKWTGLDNGNWQTGTTGANENWVLQAGATATPYLTNDDVLFDDSAGGVTTININAANVSPFATTFDNTSKDYTLGSTGAFGIASGRLTKNGSGSLTITNANTYSGNTVVNNGVLDVSTDGAQLYSGAAAITTAAVTVNTGGVLVVKNFGQAATTGLGSSSLGNLLNTGGQVVLDGGTLRFNNETAARGRVVNINAGGGILDVVNSSNYSMTAASMIFSGSNNVLTLTGDSSSTGSISSVIGGTGVSVVKNGAALWTLAGANTFSGGATISAGTLAASVAGGLGTGNVTNNSVLNLTGGGLTYTGLSNTTAGALGGNGVVNVTLGTGTATTVLNGNYSLFSGTWNVGIGAAAGAGKVQMNGADNAAATINVLSNATLYTIGASVLHGAAIVLNGGDTGESIGQLRLESGAVWAGPVTLAGAITGAGDGFFGNNTLGNVGVISGAIGETGGARDFSKVGAGTIALTGASTYTGATTITAGVLQLGDGTTGNDGTIAGTSGVINNATLAFNRFGLSSAAYPISGSGAVVKNGVGTQVLAGVNSFSGATTVNSGTLTLDYTTEDNTKLSDTAVLTLGGGTLNLEAGTHTEVVASTTLAAGTSSSVTRTSGSSVLQMGDITANAGATIDFAAPNIATTNTLNNVDGYLGTWATINNGADLAVNSTNTANGLITAPAYTDVTRLNGGTQVIADGAASNVRIIEGTGSAANITLGAATTSIASLNQSAVGGSSAAIIDPAGQTLATGSIFVSSGAGSLTIGTGANNGNLQALSSGGGLGVNATGSITVTVNSAIVDNTSSTLTKVGTGILALNGINSFAGGTSLSAGTLQLGSTTALGTGSLILGGGSLDSSVADLVNANNNAQAWNANFSFVGTQNLDLGTGPVTTNGARTVTVSANTLTVGGSFSPSATAGSHLTKLGSGTLVLNGNTALGNNGIIVNGGTVRFGGTLTTNTGTGAAGSTFRIGNLANASAAWVQTGGSVTLSVTDVDGMNLGNADNAAAAFGSMTIAGGSFSAPRINVGGSGANPGTNGVGIMNLLSGSSASFSAFFIGGRTATNTGSVTIAGGSLDLSNAALVSGRIGSWGGGRLEVNIGANLGGLNVGATVNTGANPYSAVASSVGGQGIVNLLGGTLTTNAISSPAGASTGTGINQINFNGGTLRCGTAANATFIPAIATGAAPGSGVFVRSGGAIIDTNLQNVNIATALLAPAGGEVTGITVTGAEAAATFIAAPYVRIVGGNNDATAIAKLNPDGSLDSIILTNPGSGYASAPTVTLVGGTTSGGANVTTGTATATVGASTSGGLTKNSTGFLTLSANNTYAGVTTINAGSITLNSPIPNPNTSYVVNSGGQMYGGWAVPGVTFANSITISGLGVVEAGINASAIRPSNNQIFSGTITLAAASQIGMIDTTAACTFSGQITGAFPLTVQGAFNGNSGTQTYTLANTGTPSDYSGNTSISAVDYGAARTGAKTILRLGVGDQIPNGSGMGNLVFNGADANHQTIFELNGFNETVNGVSNAAAAGAIIRNTATGASTLTIGDADTTSSFSGVIADGGSGKTLGLTKTGIGTVTLAGANSFSGDTTVNAGTLELADNAQLRFVLGASGVNNSITGAGTATLDGDFVIDTTAADALATGSWTLESVATLTGAYGSSFTVVGFVDAGSNKWTKANGAKTYTFDETTGILTLAATPGYSGWAATNSAGGTINDDHDNDGVANGIEYLLGGPAGNTTGFTALPGLVDTAGTLSVTWPKGSGYIGVYGTDFVVETSATLTGVWTAETSPGATIADSPAEVKFTFPGGPAYSGKNFARLKVTGP